MASGRGSSVVAAALVLVAFGCLLPSGMVESRHVARMDLGIGLGGGEGQGAGLGLGLGLGLGVGTGGVSASGSGSGSGSVAGAGSTSESRSGSVSVGGASSSAGSGAGSYAGSNGSGAGSLAGSGAGSGGWQGYGHGGGGGSGLGSRYGEGGGYGQGSDNRSGLGYGEGHGFGSDPRAGPSRSIAPLPGNTQSATTTPLFPGTRKAQELSTAQPPHAPTHPLQIPRPPPLHPNTSQTTVPRPQKTFENRRANCQSLQEQHARSTPCVSGCDGVQAEQQPDRDTERDHVPPLRARPGGRHLAGGQGGRHRVRAVPLGSRHRAGGVPHGGLRGGARRRLLPRHVAPLGLPRRHVRPHRGPPLLHRLRLRRHPQGSRGGRLRPRVQGVQARGLLQLAAEEGGEQQELEQDQELPPGRQGLQEPAGQEGDVGQVHPHRSLPHRVRVLQASHQLRLHLRQQHAVDRHHQLDGPGLQHMGQRRRGALLRLPVVQGRHGGHAQARLEARRRHQHRLPRLHRHRLLRRLLRVQEQPQGQPQQRRLPRRLETRRIRLIGSALWPVALLPLSFM